MLNSPQHVVRRLDHPHLCGYLGVCIAAPQFSLVYKFYEHGSLADRLRNKGTGNPSPLGAGAGKAAASGVCIGGSGGNGGSGTALAPLGSAELFTVGQDVAEGMRYLHQVRIPRACRSRFCPHPDMSPSAGCNRFRTLVPAVSHDYSKPASKRSECSFLKTTVFAAD